MTSGWAYYRDLFRRRWRTLVGAVTAGLVGGAGCSAVIIVLIHRQLSGVENTGLLMPAAYVGSIALYLVISTLSEYALLSLSQDELRRLRMKLSARILELPLERVEELGGARLAASLTDDLVRVSESIRRVTTLALNGSLLVGVAAYLAWLSPGLLAVTAVLLGVGTQMYRWPVRRMRLLDRYWARLREGYDTLLRRFDGLTRGTKELLMHRDRRAAFFDQGLGEAFDGLRNDQVRASTLQNFVYRLGDLLYYAVLGLALFVLPRTGMVEPDVITGFVVAGLYALVPFTSIVNFGPDFGAARVSLGRLEELGVVPTGAAPPEAPGAGVGSSGPAGKSPAPGPSARPTAPEPAPGSPPPPRLRLESLEYVYPTRDGEAPFQLGPLDLELPPGELTFLTGGNGSGKTTLFKILCGLYLPTGGRLVADGTEVTRADLEDYRRRLSVVFTDFHLFDRFYGLDPATVDRRATEWLERLELVGKVEVRGGRLSTTDLSEGQRKRLALLTALLEDRPVFLFDEWAADQDPHFKEIFYTELLPELKARGRTVVAITHDDRWYPTADRVVKLVDGRVAADRAPSAVPPG